MFRLLFVLIPHTVNNHFNAMLRSKFYNNLINKHKLSTSIDKDKCGTIAGVLVCGNDRWVTSKELTETNDLCLTGPFAFDILDKCSSSKTICYKLNIGNEGVVKLNQTMIKAISTDLKLMNFIKYYQNKYGKYLYKSSDLSKIRGIFIRQPVVHWIFVLNFKKCENRKRRVLCCNNKKMINTECVCRWCVELDSNFKCLCPHSPP